MISLALANVSVHLRLLDSNEMTIVSSVDGIGESAVKRPVVKDQRVHDIHSSFARSRRYFDRRFADAMRLGGANFRLDSTHGLPAHDVTVEAVTYEGRKAVRVTPPLRAKRWRE
jgi:hypothetical protein